MCTCVQGVGRRRRGEGKKEGRVLRRGGKRKARREGGEEKRLKTRLARNRLVGRYLKGPGTRNRGGGVFLRRTGIGCLHGVGKKEIKYICELCILFACQP